MTLELFRQISSILSSPTLALFRWGLETIIMKQICSFVFMRIKNQTSSNCTWFVRNVSGNDEHLSQCPKLSVNLLIVPILSLAGFVGNEWRVCCLFNISHIFLAKPPFSSLPLWEIQSRIKILFWDTKLQILHTLFVLFENDYQNNSLDSKAMICLSIRIILLHDVE